MKFVVCITLLGMIRCGGLYTKYYPLAEEIVKHMTDD
jgi:hypothetical protein